MISSGFGGLSAGMILRSFLNAGLEVVELFADLGDDLLLLPTDPATGGDLDLQWLISFLMLVMTWCLPLSS